MFAKVWLTASGSVPSQRRAVMGPCSSLFTMACVCMSACACVCVCMLYVNSNAFHSIHTGAASKVAAVYCTKKIERRKNNVLEGCG